MIHMGHSEMKRKKNNFTLDFPMDNIFQCSIICKDVVMRPMYGAFFAPVQVVYVIFNVCVLLMRE